ncbi:hypothetical protein E2C01_050662 [Portunus trituberculatus]|uniref:Uncharacterized protein n=1 Tax=Portunus trituberculatus TaxID=210409 RepID=A0A5B7GHL6_PORTR|nr:hypothetical protein [Portunus trituberculatus]
MNRVNIKQRTIHLHVNASCHAATRPAPITPALLPMPPTTHSSCSIRAATLRNREWWMVT